MLENRIVRVGTFVIGLYFVLSLTRSIYSLWRKEDIVLEEEKRLEEVRRENKELNESLENHESPDYVKEQARDVLGMGKWGEYVVIIPKVTPMPTLSPTPVLDNWRKWINLYK